VILGECETLERMEAHEGIGYGTRLITGPEARICYWSKTLKTEQQLAVSLEAQQAAPRRSDGGHLGGRRGASGENVKRVIPRRRVGGTQ